MNAACLGKKAFLSSLLSSTGTSENVFFMDFFIHSKIFTVLGACNV